jgi:pyruvate-formate lyase-activating enzyme
MEKSNWSCAAIDHGVTVFPTGKIGPCCKISADYLKPASELSNPNRFADLKTAQPPAACHACVSDEYRHMPSYRSMFNSLKTSASGLQFVDIRNTNLCNLKCRYCGPHFSSSWARELGRTVPIVSTPIDQQQLITDSLHWMYFTGGEPLINGEHWDLLEHLVATDRAPNITLVYNSNLTVLQYKNRNITDIWAHFKKVEIKCSIDAVGPDFEYIRSGADWNRVSQNIDTLLQLPVDLILAPVISLLNIWRIGLLCEYAQRKKIKIAPAVLVGPDYLALDVIPDQLKAQALAAVEPLKNHIDSMTYKHICRLIENNQNQCLFNHAISHILLLDNLRGEKLFDLLPFGAVAQQEILENHEYESK